LGNIYKPPLPILNVVWKCHWYPLGSFCLAKINIELRGRGILYIF
jgi:hypothetical protein